MKKILLTLAILAGAFSTQARQPEPGYRGFVDWHGEVSANVIDAVLFGGGDGTFYTGATTTHGYQLKPWLYVGGGAGFIMWPKYSQLYAVPVYADCRIDLGKRLFSPYFDVKLGGNTVRGGGVYFSATVGLSVKVWKEYGVNFGLGYTMTGLKQYYDYVAYDDYTLNGYQWVNSSLGHYYDGTISLRLGLEF